MDSRLARIAKTFTFRLALVYVGLFSLSVVLLFTFIYTFATHYMHQQIEDSILIRYSFLQKDYSENGSSAVEDRIREFLAKNSDSSEIYLLVNRDNEKIAGNLNEWPDNAVKEAPFGKEGMWAHFTIEDPQNSEGVAVVALLVPLSKWRSVVIGETLRGNERIQQAIVQAFWASLILTFGMASLGTLIMTRSVTRRINVINRLAHTIMHGELSARIPFTPGGDEFDELSNNLNSMLDTIETLLRSLSEFASNIAHDLRSPLTRMINRLDSGLRTIDRNNPAYPLLEKNIHDMQELVGTFNSILKISELEANTAFRKFEPCDVQQILSKLIEFYEPYAAEKHIVLENRLQAALVMYGEKNLLTQAFANLIDNAIKFTPEGGFIIVEIEQKPRLGTITIADSGAGIPKEYRDRVFEKFFRLEQSRNAPGNGLGLSLVAAIARIHGMTITLEDNTPGLVVQLSVPLPEEEAQKNE